MASFVRGKKKKQFTCNLLRLNAFYMQIVVSLGQEVATGRGPDVCIFRQEVTKFLFMILNELVFL